MLHALSGLHAAGRISEFDMTPQPDGDTCASHQGDVRRG
ncbi:FIG01046048: hypothetical protein [Salmonella enterica subsp. enterica serovar Manhattan str. 111113]|nr:FIG01046048: hypothetical protein [Salmonella enterica subsp. enterica serovar Manhattan str. 111113]